MARRIPAALTHDLLSVAETLAQQSGTANVRQACMRRAVSSSYYAVFHALSYVCADRLVGWSQTDILPPIYRSLDHAPVRNKLNGRDALQIDPALPRIGALFAKLQEERHKADYSPPSALFNRTKCLTLIADARDAIALIEGLETKARLQLAILLVTRQR